MSSETTTPYMVHFENPQRIIYQTPEIKSIEDTQNTDKPRENPWRDIIIAITCCVFGIIMFSMLMGSDMWYWGVISGVALFATVRCLYGWAYNPTHGKPSAPPATVDECDDPLPPV